MAVDMITDRVKQLVRMRGPLIPSQISKEIGTNILMASAILSELSSHGDVKISSVKVGGTPLYYVAGQEPKLQNYLTSLHQREKDAFEKLKSSGVLRDSALDPVTRVALREIKDFAKPLDVSIGDTVEIFWKWYLLSNEEAEIEIKKLMGIGKSPEQELQHQPQQQLPALEPKQHTPITSQIQETLQPQTTPHAAKKASKPKAEATSSSEFSSLVSSFLSKNGIETEAEIASARTRNEYVVLLPSPVGKLRYYCVAKNKKTCTDADISSALVQGQLKKMPVLLLTRGELSKKAQELLSKEVGAVVIKKI